MTMDIQIQLKEGMKIMPIEAYRSKKNEPEYTLVKSKDDGELYGFFNKDIIKISDINEEEYICTSLDAMEEEREYLEIKIRDERSKLLDHRDNHGWAIKEALKHLHAEEGEYVDIPVRKITCTREEYWKSNHGENCIEIKLRDMIKGLYDKAEIVDNEVRRVL